MNISLIGMSGSGKSYWSKQLEKKGFKRFGCDDLIEQRLEKELTRSGNKGIHDVAKWMGHPFDPQYPAHSEKYLRLEKEVMLQILSYVKKYNDTSENIVIDTTGSVIYTGDDILRELSHLTTVIYLKVPESHIEKLYAVFLKDPKPVLWGNMYRKKNGETNLETLKNCYCKLLESRAKQYEKIAHKIVDYSSLINNLHALDSIFLS